MSKRINARLDPKLARKLKKAQSASKKTVTDIVTESVDQYCDGLLRAADSEHLTPYQALVATGFIGGFKGPSDLSVNYKSALTESLGEKYGTKQ